MTLIYVFLGIYGAVLGSFVNMLIFRLPNDELLNQKWSFCDFCRRPLTLKNKIPIISYLLQMGKTHCCQARLPILYETIEFLCGLVPILFFVFFPENLNLVNLLIFPWIFALLLAHVVIDWLHFLLFDVISVALFGLFLIVYYRRLSFPESLIAPILAYGIPWLVNFIFEKIKKKEGMGMGDFKLYAVFAPFLGVKGGFTLLFTSCFLGSVFGIIYLYFIKKNIHAPMPFGPFIIFAGVAQLIFSIDPWLFIK